MLSKNGGCCLLAFLVGLVLLYPSVAFVPSQRGRANHAFRSTTSGEPKSKTVMGPPADTKPDYESIHGPLGKLADKVFMSVFRIQMADRVGIDSQLPKVGEARVYGIISCCSLLTVFCDMKQDDYAGLIELTAAMNARYSDRREVQNIAQDVLSK